ncbi:transcription-associated protein 1 [Didymella sp. IMI 355093]|nr:transcription-associated protein 1 [Didymella sp. IMI 355093]
MATHNFEAMASKLDDPSSDIRAKDKLVVEIRDNIENYCQGVQYAQFMNALVPAFLKILDGNPVFISTSPEQRIRNCVLEILHRLPMNPGDAVEPHAAKIVDKLMSLVKLENEDNAVLCMKTIMDFQRHQTKALQDRVQPFLDLIQEMFETMEQAVHDTFDNATPAPASQGVPSTPSNHQYSQSPRPNSPATALTSGSAGDLGQETQQTRMLLKGMQSFKVLAECPIIVVSLFQAYRNCVNKNVKLFVPLIKNVLLLQAKPQEKAHEDAKAQGKIFTGVSKDIRNRAAFGDFITAQVKTMSFLAYLLRVYANQLNDFLPTLPDIVVRLLKDCPREKSGARKELLVAIRHIINFNFRKIFLKKIDELLEERTLIGDGLTVYETMRPLAYSMLADLIHHLRDSLSKEQIRRTVEVYTKNLHDSFPGTSFQTMSAKLLLNMAECIAKLEPKEDARYFLIMILNAIGDKFAAMNRQYHNAVKLSAQYSQPSIDASDENHMAVQEQPPDWDEIDIFNATPIKTSNPRDRSSDPIADNKFLFKNLLHGLKNLFYQLRACNPAKIKEEIDAANASANWHEVSFGYNAEEVEVLIKLFREGAKVFRYYGTDKSAETQGLSPGDLMGNQHMMSSGKEEKELLETFATVFHHIDPATFHEVFSSEIPHLYDMMFDHPALLHVPQFLLASEATSPSFSGMLLQFLMDRIEEVGTADVKKSSILLRLFKLSFMAVTLFSQQNEQVLLPHVSKIITKSIQLSTTAEEPMNYFLLLRSLFRSIGGGRFEHLYKEILPLLEMLLDVLNNLLITARKPAERDLFVELSLTVPARLSNLLPHLSYLMRPLVVALRAGSDLVGQGLRTLELCVDNLTADYLDPIMAPVIDELMAALWEHLKPNPYSHFHAHTTMRILGKLGGRNRKFITGPPELNYQPYSDDQSSIDIRLIGSTKDRAFPAVVGIEAAIAKLHEVPKTPATKKSDTFHKQQAFRLITAHTKLMIGFDSLPDDFAQLVRLQANDLCNNKLDVGADVLAAPDREKSIPKKTVEQETLKKLLKACIFAVSVPELKVDAEPLVANLAKHFTLLEFGSHLAVAKHKSKPFEVHLGEGPVVIASEVIADAIGDSLASEHPDVRAAAEQAILTMRDAAKAIFGSSDKLHKFPFFNDLSNTFCHNCHADDWFMKSGGTRGIEIIIKKAGLDSTWMTARHFELIRALNFVMKDMPIDLDSKTRIQAEGLIENLIRQCHKTTTKEDFEKSGNITMRLCAQLVGDLSHMNKNVREATQKAFQVLSEVTSLGVHELIAPVKTRLIVPIWTKPLRALPFSIQIAYIDAITFCLKLKNGILEFNDELTRLLMESLALADAEDEGLASKPFEQRNAEHIVNLRVACIRLLSTAQSFPEFSTTPPNQTFLRIIAVFFKCLYSKSPEVIEAANIGLSGVISATNKLPKDVLQSGLRPILVNLQDPRKLSVENLDGLARLLKLLTNYFKVEIGTRLLDHLKSIADQNSLQKISFTMIEQNPKMKIVTGIFNIFHLLPPAAATFLKQIIEKVIELESSLRRTHYSPFREPLIKYLCMYPSDTWTHFAPNLKDQTQGRFFAQLLEDPESGALRTQLSEDVPGFLQSFQFEGEDKDVCQAQLNAIHIAYALSQFEETSNWLVTHDDLRKSLFEAGRSLEKKLRQNLIDPELRLATEQAGDQIMFIFTTYLKHEPNNLDFFFELIDTVTSEELKASPRLFDYIYEQIISGESVDYWKTLINRCIDIYTSRNSSQKTKTFIFHNIVNPIFAMDVKRNWNSLFDQKTEGTKLMDKNMTETIHKRLWLPQSLTDTSEETAQLGVDHSRMELLQLTTLLLKYYSGMIEEFRKDVIKFGWNYIKLEDIINKYAAYVLVAFFIAVYETPKKIAAHTYQSLLKAHQNEGRSLVMQALELMAPVLRKRMGGSERMPLWIQHPRKILSEESSNLQQLMSIFNFVVRHPDLFYEGREHLSPIIITALSKIAQPPNPSTDAKKLALNLISLIRTWEERTATETAAGVERPSSSPSASKRKADGTVVPSGPHSKEFVAQASIRMGLIKYLIQFIAYLPERFPVNSPKPKDTAVAPTNTPQPAEICRKAVQLLHDLLAPRLWNDLDLDVMLTKKIEDILLTEMKQDDKAEVFNTRMINTLQIIKVIVNVKSDDWVLQRVPIFQKILDKPIRSENADVQASLHAVDENEDGTMKLQPTLKRILEVMPEPVTDEEGNTEESTSTEFVNFLGAVATEALSNGSYVCAINILWTLCQKRPEEIDQHIPQVMKAFQGKMAKDHLAGHSGTPGQAVPPNMRPEGANPPTDPREIEIQTDLVLKTVDILAARMNELGENRRPYLSVLASLVERSQVNSVCMKVLDLVEGWIFHSNEPVPTLKEKTAVLSKMLLFEHRPDTSLLTRFLDLVIRIYEDPKITRSELTVRMEHAFLIGTRAQDVEMRNRYMAIFDKSLSRTAASRLSYVLASQNWDTLSDSYWLSQVIHLMFGSIEMNSPAELHEEDFKLMQPSTLYCTYSKDSRIGDVMVDDDLESLISSHRRFVTQLGDVKIKDIFEPLGHLQHTDNNLAHDIWVAFFPLAWTALTKDDQSDLEKGMAALLTKDFHNRQLDKRPNCVATMLDAIVHAKPRVKFPPHIMKYLAQTYNAWYTAAVYMEESAISPVVDVEKLRESNLDALLEVYSGLQEDDLFYGTWRRRCQFLESNAALSYEQCGIWDKAQQMYEAAQIKARTSVLPFSTGEYMLWEDHWVICAQKLQQWEILSDFAKHENFNDLYLESTWRSFEAWQNAETREQLDTTIKAVSDAPTPRRVFFQTFMSLLKLHAKQESPPEFHRLCDESIQLSIRKWHQLPRRITQAHIPLLQHFQQLVELHDASVICQSLAQTTQANLDMKSQELKLLLSTWRDRLPNFWDDINAWQDLVTWRQHIFQLINGVYLNLLPPNQNNASGNSFAYRGYHETAWIINRFAHVARKHNLPEVCINQLGRIYTLPNIEIQEAFLKLREQAKCHYQIRADLNSGLDVINNTNLNYFGPQQKAEFYTLKGMFLAKLGQKSEAGEAFGTALYFDIKLPKAWAEWGRYNDMLFKEEPQNLERAEAALSCYLEAASQFKNAKSRKLLGRVLWLLSLDNPERRLAEKFEEFKGDTPAWYWITYIPQLLNSLSRQEAPIARSILGKLAKTYPQALYCHLRTTREDMAVLKKQHDQKEAKEKAARAAKATQQGNQSSPAPKQGSPDARPGSSGNQNAAPNGDAKPAVQTNTPGGTVKTEGNAQGSPAVNGAPTVEVTPPAPKKPWDHVEEISAILKTAFPLLALSMETMLDQIHKNFKCPPDEDAYRLIVALLNDGLSYVGRQPTLYARDTKLPSSTEGNITRFAESVLPAHIRKSFESDFIKDKPTMFEYIQKLRTWRNRFEERLDRRRIVVPLEQYTHQLSEFRFLKFDDVEVPGQYLLHRDKNSDFVRIERFLSDVELVRGVGVCHRRIKIRGHDGSTHPFAIQFPTARSSRREERIIQLFRIFNGILSKRKESRRRNLQFHLPLMVPITPSVRLIQDDPSVMNLQGIYEDYCRKNGVNKDEPILFSIDKLRALQPKNLDHANSIRLETFSAVQEKYVPNTVVQDYFRATFPSFDDFWLFRRTFSYHLAALTFMTYVMHMNTRFPHKLLISRSTGRVWGSELIPSMAVGKPILHNSEPVPFRLTPNLQVMLGPLNLEGIFAPAVMTVARCLIEPEGELEMQLSIFMRDEMNHWYTSQHKIGALTPDTLRESVQQNSDLVVKRASSIGSQPSGQNLPANQTMVDLVSVAVHPQKLAMTDPLWMAYL